MSGFTLIELLVVIVIIGILATISVASFNGYQERAHYAKAMSEVRQSERAWLSECIKSGATCKKWSTNENFSQLDGNNRPVGWSQLVPTRIESGDFNGSPIMKITSAGSITSTGGNWFAPANISLAPTETDYEVFFVVRQTSGSNNFQIGKGYYPVFRQPVSGNFEMHSLNINCQDALSPSHVAPCEAQAHEQILTFAGEVPNEEFEIAYFAVYESN